MTITIFGQGDWVCLPQPKVTSSFLGSHAQYTHPSYKNCFSQWGFAVPMSYDGIPYALSLEARLPKTPDAIKHYPRGSDYFVIDPAGELWTVGHADHTGDKGDEFQALSYNHIDRHQDGWWIAGHSERLGFDGRRLLGFLYTNPSQEEIATFMREVRGGEEFQWFQVSVIIKELNEKYTTVAPADNTPIDPPLVLSVLIDEIKQNQKRAEKLRSIVERLKQLPEGSVLLTSAILKPRPIILRDFEETGVWVKDRKSDSVQFVHGTREQLAKLGEYPDNAKLMVEMRAISYTNEKEEPGVVQWRYELVGDVIFEIKESLRKRKKES